MNDKELIRHIQMGEKESFDRLIEKYYDDIYRYCYYRTGNEQAAADCTQDTFLHFIQALSAYVEQDKFKAWIFRIAANACTDYFREKRAFCVEEAELEARGCEDAGLKQKEDEEYVQKALLKLTDIQREMIVLRFYHGFKIREIADILHIGLPAAKSRLKQGMDRMKQIMEGEDKA